VPTNYMVQQDLNPKELQGRLDIAAKDGWEVVTVTGPYLDRHGMLCYTVVYKR